MKADSLMRAIIRSSACRYAALLLMTIAASFPLTAQNNEVASSGTSAVTNFAAGDKQIAIPTPMTGMVEAGSEKRGVFDIAVPSGNWLLAAYVPMEVLPNLKIGSGINIEKYALVEIYRQSESIELSESDFTAVIDGAAKQLGTSLDAARKEAEDEFSRKAQNVAPNLSKVDLGEPYSLGVLFSKPETFGYGMIMPVTVNGNTTKMIASIIIMRIKGKLIFVYLYADYKNEETITWMHQITEKWSDAIQDANKQ